VVSHFWWLVELTLAAEERGIRRDICIDGSGSHEGLGQGETMEMERARQNQ
jgi:hypothetical protein